MKYTLLFILLFTSYCLSAQEVPGFVGGWKMDGSCQLNDISDNAPADGVLVDVFPTSDRNNVAQSASAFTQSTSYITLGAVEKFKLANDKTISFWIRPVPTGSDHVGSIFCYGTGIIIRYQEQASNLRVVVIFGNTTYITRNLTPNQWQNITITFQKDYTSTRSKVFYYADFSLVAEADQNKSSHDFSNSIALIGPADQSTLTNGFRGSLDELKIYNRTLTNVEIQNLALPVKLEFFRARKSNGSIQLTWKTSLEENVSHFVVQKSFDGISYTNLSNVPAGKFNYLQYDGSKVPATAWYRLKVVDSDQKTSFSNVVLVSDDDKRFLVYPNPVVDKIQISGTSIQGKITVVNNLGMVVRQKQFITNHAMNVSDLKPGVYYLIYSDGRNTMRSKFTKL